jgi:tRNA pseudouridine38-40 synthase
MRLQLTIAYDGSDFAGWQSQSHGKGIQDYLEKALASIRPLSKLAAGDNRASWEEARCLSSESPKGEQSGRLRGQEQGATAHRRGVYKEHTCGVAAAGSTAEGSPKGASLAGANELLLDESSTGATQLFAPAVEFGKRPIAGRRLILHAASRTDAGVHALAQCAHVDIGDITGKMADPQRWLTALNASLPPTIRILKIKRVPPTFHARFLAHHKTYRYLLWNGSVLPPLLHQRAWHLHGPLDISLLKRLAREIEGSHDFRGFTAKSGAARENTKRTLHQVSISKRGNEISFSFTGDGFLYHMVRMLVGAMVRVAQGKMTHQEFSERLQTKKRPKAPFTAPACGLYLMKISYR